MRQALRLLCDRQKTIDNAVFGLGEIGNDLTCRFDPMYASDIAQREYDERGNAMREADANLRATQAALQSAKLSLGYTEVRAPVAGRVGKLEITVGNLVAAGPGAPVLTTLVSVSPIYASFDADVIQAGKPVLVDFWAEWCGPCRMIAPLLDEVATSHQDKLQVAKMNVDENRDVPAKFGIRGIPTLMLFKDGQLAATKVGAMSKAQLTAFIDQQLA